MSRNLPKKGQDFDRLSRENAEMVTEVVEEIRSKDLALNSFEMLHPAKLGQIVALHAFGEHSAREIGRQVGCCHHTVNKVINNHAEAWQHLRVHHARGLATLATDAQLAVHRRVNMLLENDDDLRKLNPKDAAIMLGVITDKAREAHGEASSVVEHRSNSNPDEFKDFIKQAKAKVIDVETSTDHTNP